jgi:ankyrin repeat protein
VRSFANRIEIGIDLRADVNARDAAGSTALHAAVELGSVAMARLLVEYGALFYNLQSVTICPDSL